ncbi:hypothetical protein LPJ79_001454 [Coemansia sp. RSA 1821]|nr:hypothetical protein LPJ79_001454 [Coemansia sp. RSA 1821]
MGTEFEKLLRLAEQNTLDIQRISLEKKRQNTTQPSNREAIEKRRKVELERRIQQRDYEEKQREARMQAALERRRRERLEAEQQAKALAARKKPTVSKPERPARAGASRTGVPLKAPEPKSKPAQPLSYDELMRIAEGKQAPVAKRNDVGRREPVNTASAVRRPAQSRQQRAKQAAPQKDTVRSSQARVSKAPASRSSAIPQQRTRKPSPEREIDRFGVRSSSTIRNRPAPSAATARVRADRPINSSHVRQQQPKPQHAAPAKARNAAKRHYAEKAEESEYDSMDDFIVDDEDEGYRVGTIRKMFGVQYHDVNDEDDDDMEVSATQLMREDLRSARIGRMEDEEEERKLEEEERRRQQRQRMRGAR